MNLEAEKHAYETERTGYHVQCKQQQDEIQQMQQKLAKKANDCEDAKNNLKNAVDKNQQLTERLSISEQKNNTENDQTEVSKKLGGKINHSYSSCLNNDKISLVCKCNMRVGSGSIDFWILFT